MAFICRKAVLMLSMEKAMSDTRYLSELFDIQPPNWGLRGDPWFWQDMKKSFAATPFPYSSSAGSCFCSHPIPAVEKEGSPAKSRCCIISFFSRKPHPLH